MSTTIVRSFLYVLSFKMAPDESLRFSRLTPSSFELQELRASRAKMLKGYYPLHVSDAVASYLDGLEDHRDYPHVISFLNATRKAREDRKTGQDQCIVFLGLGPQDSLFHTSELSWSIETRLPLVITTRDQKWLQSADALAHEALAALCRTVACMDPLSPTAFSPSS